MLQRRKFFLGRAIRGSDIKDISFFDPDGKEMSDEAWNAGFVKCLGVRLAGDMINEVDERGEPIIGDTLLLLLNAHWEELQFTLPATREEHVWETLVDTADPDVPLRVCRGGEQYPLFGRSLALLRTTAATRPARPVIVRAGRDAAQGGSPRNQPATGQPPLLP